MIKKKMDLLNNIQKNTRGHNLSSIKNIYNEWILNKKDFKRKSKDFSKAFLDVARQEMILQGKKARYQIDYDNVILIFSYFKFQDIFY